MHSTARHTFVLAVLLAPTLAVVVLAVATLAGPEAAAVDGSAVTPRVAADGCDERFLDEAPRTHDPRFRQAWSTAALECGGRLDFESAPTTPLAPMATLAIVDLTVSPTAAARPDGFLWVVATVDGGRTDDTGSCPCAVEASLSVDGAAAGATPAVVGPGVGGVVVTTLVPLAGHQLEPVELSLAVANLDDRTPVAVDATITAVHVPFRP